jgi:integrase/recombinase XerC
VPGDPVGHDDWAATRRIPATAARRSWQRATRDWKHPTHDELIDWVTVPGSADGKHRRAACLRSFYTWYATRGAVSPQVAGMVPVISGSKKRPKPIPDQLLAEAMAAAEPHKRAAMVLGRFAGLRASEIAAVHTDDLEGDTLYVVGKGGRERYVDVHPQVLDVVSAAHGWVFPSHLLDEAGRPMPVQGATVSKWMSHRTAAGWLGALPEGWTCHTLRHAFATDLYERTRDLVLVAEQLGHASVKTTERYVKNTGDARDADQIRDGQQIRAAYQSTVQPVGILVQRPRELALAHGSPGQLGADGCHSGLG